MQMYLSLKLHFSTEKYDANKFNGKVKNVSLEKRNDKLWFTKLTKHRDPKGLLIANLSVNPSMWVGDILSPEGEERFRRMIGRWETISYTFSEDLKRLDDDFQTNFKVIEHQHPFLLKLYLQQKVCLETMTIMDDLIHYYPIWQEQLLDPVWKSKSLIVSKFKPFVKYDSNKMKRTFLKRFKKA